MMFFKKFEIFSLAAITLFVFGCSNNPSSPNVDKAIKLSIKAINTANARPGNLGKITAGNVTITSARVVIDKVKLKSSIGDSLDFKLKEPFVKDLVVGATLHEIETIQTPGGSFKELEIELDELKAEDGSVFTANPELQNRSILVKGYLNDTPSDTFEFSSDLEEEQEQEFEPPIVLDDSSTATNIVLTIDMDTWFVDGNGNFIDPRAPENRSAIEENIKNSIDVFEDKNDDGEKDGDD